MQIPSRFSVLPRPFQLLAAAILLTATAPLAYPDILSSNLTNFSDGAETASGTTWVAGGFHSGSADATLQSVTLLLANTVAGEAEVDLYSDATLQPDSLIERLLSPETYPSSIAPATFTSSGTQLAANTDYWLVLKSIGGQFDWSWTTDNTGEGAGFTGTWGESDDAGSTWFTYDIYPTQFSVEAATSAVPEPHTALLLAAGIVLLSGIGLSKLQQPKNKREPKGTRNEI